METMIGILMTLVALVAYLGMAFGPTLAQLPECTALDEPGADPEEAMYRD